MVKLNAEQMVILGQTVVTLYAAHAATVHLVVSRPVRDVLPSASVLLNPV